MLLGLRIANFAVIEAAEVEFGGGLTVLTGETGAGKSILVDALGLLLGGRADPDLVRAGCEEASVEGVFSRTDELAERLVEHGLPDLGEEVCVRRVIGRSGRNKAYVNGALVTIGILGRVLRGEVDVAGQHEHVSLFDPDRHLRILDRAADCERALAEYRQAYAQLKELGRRIDELGGDEQAVRQRLESLRFQVDELSRLDPRDGEDARLEEERKRLLCADKIRRALGEAESALALQESSAVDLLGRAAVMLAEASRSDVRLAPLAQRLETSRSETDDVAREVSRQLAAAESDPQRLAEVEDRLDAIRRLCRRHGCELAGLLVRAQELRQSLEELEGRRERLSALELERKEADTLARNLAKALSCLRSTGAARLSEDVRSALSQLAIPKAAFEVEVVPGEALGPDGLDAVQFLFSANAGEPARPLAKVASGGEASRLLLALKEVLAGSDPCGAYVLDEADAGVSGAVADVVGRMIKEVSRDRQVLCITHLPQVAAYADAHLVVEKRVVHGRTVSRVAPVAGEDRTQELAKMLSGVEVTREALGAAEALVRSAQRAQAASLRPRRAAPRRDRARKAG